MDPNIKPLPESYRGIPVRLRPMHPPIFVDYEPSRDDIALAVALIEALDPESRRWYASALDRLRAVLGGDA